MQTQISPCTMDTGIANSGGSGILRHPHRIGTGPDLDMKELIHTHVGAVMLWTPGGKLCIAPVRQVPWSCWRS